MYKFELAASLAGYTNLEMGALSFTIRCEYCGGMLTIFQCHFHHPKYELPGENQGNLELDDQGDNNIQV